MVNNGTARGRTFPPTVGDKRQQGEGGKKKTGGLGLEADLHGDSRGVQEVDDADSQLETGPESFRHFVRGPYA